MIFLFLRLFCGEQVYFSTTFFFFCCFYTAFLEMKGKHQVLVLSCGFTLEILWLFFSLSTHLLKSVWWHVAWPGVLYGKAILVKRREDGLLNEWMNKCVELKESNLFSLITNGPHYPTVKCVSFFWNPCKIIAIGLK